MITNQSKLRGGVDAQSRVCGEEKRGANTVAESGRTWRRSTKDKPKGERAKEGM